MVFKRYSIVLRGPKFANKISPTPLHHHHQTEPLRRGRILTLPSECRCRNQDSSGQATFFNLLLSNFGESVWIVASVCCSYLTGAAPGVVFCCCSSSASGFDVLCVQRRYSAYLGYNEWLFELRCLSIISNQSDHSPLTSDINKAFSSTQLPLTGYFLFFGPFSVNPRDGSWKSQ